ncbi:ABC-type Fe3+-siderophore transport system, permease component [Roseovarius mucosus DSM 17069]|uniref:ABC-type Fe3+-siderophore transport system, permease component n=1 Tax=Roseovarius mucosus DSM 17069 TaxID=1288298 RepID=A0A0A0HRF2_9RHOB|nr:iron ABC transporter permease [Roseovarius mucosus]KGM89536.1 ABC-type Fe3+-siderophore transport system, permease component [Roseovarius mucosus DSM 17069]
MGRGTTAELTRQKPVLTLTGALALGVAILAFGALMLGPYALTPAETLAALLGRGDSQAQIVVWNIRLPRVAAAILVGAALAAAGASYQALFRNPLVSPDILGVSAGAGLGAVAGIFLSLPVAAIQASAFVGGMAAVGVVTLVAALVRNTDRTLTLVLIGVVIGALAGAATSLLKVMADPYDQLPAITFWLLGSLAAITTEDIRPALPLVLLGLVPLVLLRWRINVLSLGDEEARALGVEVGRTRFLVIAAATLITASVTALAGVVGWVGLVIPHIARMLVGPGFGRLLPTSVLIGAAYLLIVDTAARLMAQTEVPLGILTAVIGAPFFVWLLARGRRGWS